MVERDGGTGRRGTSPGGPLPHRGRRWLLGVALPAAVTVAAAALVAAWAPRLPDPVAVHWGPEGVDGVGSLGGLVAPLAVYAAVSLLLLAALSLTLGRSAIARRTVLGIATGMAVLNAGMLVAVAAVQLDAVDAYAAGDPSPGLVVATLAGLAAGALAAALAGSDEPAPAAAPPPAGAPRADLAPSEAPVWQRRARPSGRAAWTLGALVVGLLALGVGLGAASGSWWIAALVLLPVPAVVLFLVFDVTVSPAGLSVRGQLGWPSYRVPAGEVEDVEVVEVKPFSQFGGWGLRIAADRYGTVGVVVRAGTALRVVRSRDRRFVVTVDDAAEAAALLRTYADRAAALR